MKAQTLRKLRLWRLLARKTLIQVAREVRLPAYIVSAIERGEIEPPDRWVRRFEEAYGPQITAELLSWVDASQTLGPATGGLDK